MHHFYPTNVTNPDSIRNRPTQKPTTPFSPVWPKRKNLKYIIRTYIIL